MSYTSDKYTAVATASDAPTFHDNNIRGSGIYDVALAYWQCVCGKPMVLITGIPQADSQVTFMVFFYQCANGHQWAHDLRDARWSADVGPLTASGHGPYERPVPLYGPSEAEGDTLYTPPKTPPARREISRRPI